MGFYKLWCNPRLFLVYANVVEKRNSYSKVIVAVFLDSIRCWNKIRPELRNSPNLKSFKANTLRVFLIFHFLSNVFTKLRVGLSPLHDHKMKHNFNDTLSDKCAVCNRTENLQHFFSHCTRFTEARRSLFNFVHTHLTGQCCTHT